MIIINAFDIMVLLVVALCVAGAVIYLVRLKKKGKSVCCGDCSKCGMECTERIQKP